MNQVQSLNQQLQKTAQVAAQATNVTAEEIKRLQAQNKALTQENQLLRQQVETSGKTADDKTTISESLKIASDALLESSSAEDKANQTKIDVAALIKAAEASAANANNSDLGSVAALAAMDAAKRARDAQTEVLKEVEDVQKASNKVDELAKKLINDPAKVTDAQKKGLAAAKGNLTRQLKALDDAIQKVQQASAEASTQAGFAMQVYDNWEALGALFGFSTSLSPSTEGDGGATPLPSEDSHGDPSLPSLETVSQVGDTAIDNWGLIQQKFGILDLEAVSASVSESNPPSTSTTPADSSAS
ncbi:MAG: hypothetical protein AAFX78_07460 [Cyanobacteria bacterium J06638_20]